MVGSLVRVRKYDAASFGYSVRQIPRHLATVDAVHVMRPTVIELVNHDDDTIAQSANVLLQEAFPYGPKIQPAEVDQDRAATRRAWQRWWDAHRAEILKLHP